MAKQKVTLAANDEPPTIVPEWAELEPVVEPIPVVATAAEPDDAALDRERTAAIRKLAIAYGAPGDLANYCIFRGKSAQWAEDAFKALSTGYFKADDTTYWGTPPVKGKG